MYCLTVLLFALSWKHHICNFLNKLFLPTRVFKLLMFPCFFLLWPIHLEICCWVSTSSSGGVTISSLVISDGLSLMSFCQAFDAFIYIFFALEMVIKMVALGIFGRRCYLGDTWNRLDFFIVMAGWGPSVPFIFSLLYVRRLTWMWTMTGFVPNAHPAKLNGYVHEMKTILFWIKWKEKL